jgi:hypothetical protein
VSAETPGASRAGDEGRLRVRQVFSFLRSFAAGRAGATLTLAGALHRLRLADLPDHPAIERTPLLRVRRPELTPAPPPPEVLAGWVLRGWERPDGKVTVWQARRRPAGGAALASEAFADDPARPAALEAWSGAWRAWAAAERPNREAMRVFEQLYALHADIERQGERIELVLGDGRLLWQTGEGAIDHPVLLQRVDLVFDPDVPEFRVIDADRAPELEAPLLLAGGTLTGEKLHELSQELAAGAFHPLGGAATSAFLRRVVSLLGPQGALLEGPAAEALGVGVGVGASATPAAAATDVPALVRDPVLFARTRAGGLAAAFDRVLEDLERGRPLPPALARMVGVGDRDDGGMGAGVAGSAGAGAPGPLLLSKPANDEQLEVARALERHKAVLVQGPPGTGKSHTIANLVGHLAAQGKRVLVTSYASKALRIVRELVVPELRPLCVALLDSDHEGRAQLEQSIRGIVERLSSSNEAQLEARAAALDGQRRALEAEVARLEAELRQVQEDEYRPVELPGEQLAPAEAARQVEQQAHRLDLVPGPVPAGAPLPLSADELRELYQSNDLLSADDERELALELPAVAALPAPEQFAREAAAVQEAGADGAGNRFWRAAPEARDAPALAALGRALEQLARELAALAPWQRRLVAAGHAGEGEAGAWRALAEQTQAAAALWDEGRAVLLVHQPALDPALRREDALKVLTEIQEHVGASDKRAKLGGVGMLFRGSWKAVVEGCRVNGQPPTEAAHFAALHLAARIEVARAQLGQRWGRQAEAAGLPAFAALPEPPERAAAEYAQQFDRLLGLWAARWQALAAQLEALGLDWRELRADELARAAPRAPFERDLALVGTALPAAIARRLDAVARLETLRRLKGQADGLAKYRLRVGRTLQASIANLDVDSYRREHARLEETHAQVAVLARRRALLDKLGAVAPAWAAAVQARRGVHGAPLPPRELAAAWRWRLLEDELARRAARDDGALAARLAELRAQLAAITIDLVDARAWLAQLRRTGFEARQALIGWADTQRSIDRAGDRNAGRGGGAGERVPALQHKALALLARAREAVPVWIMPLARVAECFDPRQARFDVVLIDEASQCDLTGLLAVYMGAEVAIVGDHEQVSPPAAGDAPRNADQLIGQFLSGVPNNHLYVAQTSLYDLARRSFAGIIGLREHFRCVPDIIEFSNRLVYAGEIRPLRDPGSAARPHLCEYHVSQALAPARRGEVNEAEARVVAALLAAAIQLPAYAGKTFGAVSLLGDPQARRIQELVQALVPVAELERRRFLAGNAAQFQGDERDVMFLSMVDVPGGSVLAREDRLNSKQRYNVAASRARDQLWLVHCLDPRRDLQANDLRRRLIEHVRGHGDARREGGRTSPTWQAAPSAPPARTPSALEQALFQRLVQEGYEVAVQVPVGGHRLDLVVSGEAAGAPVGGATRTTQAAQVAQVAQVAIDCDGDRVLLPGQAAAAVARQAALERVGWRVRRVRGTRFYRDPDATVAALVRELRRLGVQPAREGQPRPALGPGDDLYNEIVRRAWQILRAEGQPAGALPEDPAAVAELVVEETTDPHFVIVEEGPPDGDGDR